MRYKELIPPFILALFALLFSSIFFPSLKLLPFAPFLAIAYNRSSFVRSLYLSLICGLLIDLLSSEVRFGFATLSTCMTTAILYRQKRHFFEDKPLALSLFTIVISLVFTSLSFVLVNFFGKSLPLTRKFFMSDLVIMPLIDGAYAFFWFTCPLKFYNHIRKIGIRSYFKKLIKKDEQS